jgi:prophage regulatory protein
MSARPEVTGRRTLIRLKVVVALTGLPVSSIYELMEDGVFPPSVPLSDRRVAWVESEVADWIDARIAERDARIKRIPLSRKGSGSASR